MSVFVNPPSRGNTQLNNPLSPINLREEENASEVFFFSRLIRSTLS